MPRSDFNYCIREVSGFKFIMIEDLNLGRMSVTNDIEQVVDYICRKEQILIQEVDKEYFTIYKDSDGEWTGFRAGCFIYLENNKHWLQAAKEMILK